LNQKFCLINVIVVFVVIFATIGRYNNFHLDLQVFAINEK